MFIHSSITHNSKTCKQPKYPPDGQMDVQKAACVQWSVYYSAWKEGPASVLQHG